MSIDTIVYEQPVNEHTRACLRLEHLFNQAHHALSGTSIWDSRLSLASLIDILNILDRPDLKTKLTKELYRHLANFTRLEQTPHIDKSKLSSVLAELESIVDHLQTKNGKIAQDLRDNEFIASIRQHLFNPGGGCGFEIPSYHHWLQMPINIRTYDLKNWFGQLTIIHSAVNLLLRLVRESNTPQSIIAHEGFYQSSLDPQIPCQLVRLAIPTHFNVYPEISIGRHGLCIRLFNPNLTERPAPTTQSVTISLTCCVL